MQFGSQKKKKPFANTKILPETKQDNSSVGYKSEKKKEKKIHEKLGAKLYGSDINFMFHKT